MKKGWQEKKLGDVAELSGRIGWKGLTAKEYTKEGPLFLSVHSLNYGDYVDFRDAFHISQERYDESPEIMLQKGDILICKDGAGIGKVGMIGELPDKTTINSSLLLIRRYKEEVITKYLYFSLLSPGFQSIINSRLMGATTPHLYQRDIVDFPVFVPSLPEQQRIVSVLDEAFASIAQAKSNAERNLVNAQELFESYLKGVFETKRDDWEEKKLGDIGKVSMCKRVYKEQTTTTGDIPFYKIGTFGKEPDVFIPKSLYDEFRDKFSFPKMGDILISAAGTIGRRVKYDGKPAYFQDSNIVWIDNDEKQVLNDYLYQFYGACSWNSTTGATIPRLYNDNLRQIEIAFPKSLAEQRAIVGRLEALSAETGRLEEIYQQKVESLEELKKSVLGKAFAGEL